MRTLFLTLVLSLTFCLTSYAGTTSESKFPQYDGEQEVLVNEEIGHYHEDDQRRSPVGVGADVTVWENENQESRLEALEVQARWDERNEESSVFAVAQVNVAKDVKSAFSKILDMIIFWD